MSSIVTQRRRASSHSASSATSRREKDALYVGCCALPGGGIQCSVSYNAAVFNSPDASVQPGAARKLSRPRLLRPGTAAESKPQPSPRDHEHCARARVYDSTELLQRFARRPPPMLGVVATPSEPALRVDDGGARRLLPVTRVGE